MNAVSILTQPSLTPPKEAGLLSSVQYFKKFFDIIICKNFGSVFNRFVFVFEYVKSNVSQ